MIATSPLILVTGATGLLGAATIDSLLALDDRIRIAALVRSPDRWPPLARRLGPSVARIEVIRGDVTQPGLGLAPAARHSLAPRLTQVVHLAADTRFSLALPDARRANTLATAHAVQFAEQCDAARFVFASTAFVAGTRTGFIVDDTSDATDWVNAYERSKSEAESIVARARIPWMILRPSTVVCDDESGRVTQINAVHRALRLCHAGLASMLPGFGDTPVDVVTARWVARAIAHCVLREELHGRRIHLCAGSAALPLGELLERTWRCWGHDSAWHRRAVAPPALTDLGTYRLFERAVEEAADPRLAAAVRALSRFAPQLAFPKQFDTRGASAIAETPASAPSGYWDAMLDHLLADGWRATRTGRLVA